MDRRALLQPDAGLWVRGILREDYGVDASDVTWVTTEEPHVAS
ncbi:hypothetical protein [Streptomyces sp. SD15]